VLHPDVKVLIGGLSDFDTDAAGGVEMPTGKTHVRTEGRVLGVEVDIALKGQEFTKHDGYPGSLRKRLLDSHHSSDFWVQGKRNRLLGETRSKTTIASPHRW
jgi:hypothetical protein